MANNEKYLSLCKSFISTHIGAEEYFIPIVSESPGLLSSVVDSSRFNAEVERYRQAVESTMRKLKQPSDEPWHCDYCGKTNPSSAIYCGEIGPSHCGAPRPEIERADSDLATAFPSGLIEYTYTVTHIDTGELICGADIIVATRYDDGKYDNIVWAGVTDRKGVARDQFGSTPLLAPGVYYFIIQKRDYRCVAREVVE